MGESMGESMVNFQLPIQIRYLHLQPSPELQAAIADGLSTLTPFRDVVLSGDLEVGCWIAHQDQGRTYQVALTLEPVHGTRFCTRCESRMGADARSLRKLLQEAFALACRQLGSQREEPQSTLSAEARRLHPLHGQTADERFVLSGRK